MRTVDPRVLVVTTFVHLIMVFLAENRIHQIMVAISVIVVGILVGAYKRWLSRKKIIVASILIVNISYYTINKFYDLSGSQLALSFRLLFVLLTTLMLSNTENIGKLHTTLVSFGLPSKIAWMISTSVRRTAFAIEEVEHSFRVLKGNPTLSDKFTWTKPQGIVSLLVLTWVKAIRRAKEFDTALLTRGYSGEYFDLYVDNIAFTKYDVFLFTYSISSFLTFLII